MNSKPTVAVVSRAFHYGNPQFFSLSGPQGRRGLVTHCPARVDKRPHQFGAKTRSEGYEPVGGAAPPGDEGTATRNRVPAEPRISRPSMPTLTAVHRVRHHAHAVLVRTPDASPHRDVT